MARTSSRPASATSGEGRSIRSSSLADWPQDVAWWGPATTRGSTTPTNGQISTARRAGDTPSCDGHTVVERKLRYRWEWGLGPIPLGPTDEHVGESLAGEATRTRDP